jgi:hypothetical protein
MWCWEDKQCENVKDALDRFSGVECFEWCWGHGKEPFMVRFGVKKLSNIKPILGALLDIAPSEGVPVWALEIELLFGYEDDFVFRLKGPILTEEEISIATLPLIKRLIPRSIGSWKIK